MTVATFQSERRRSAKSLSEHDTPVLIYFRIGPVVHLAWLISIKNDIISAVDIVSNVDDVQKPGDSKSLQRRNTRKIWGFQCTLLSTERGSKKVIYLFH